MNTAGEGAISQSCCFCMRLNRKYIEGSSASTDQSEVLGIPSSATDLLGSFEPVIYPSLDPIYKMDGVITGWLNFPSLQTLKVHKLLWGVLVFLDFGGQGKC